MIGSCAIASAICLELASIPIEAGHRHCGVADSGAPIPAGGVEREHVRTLRSDERGPQPASGPDFAVNSSP